MPKTISQRKGRNSRKAAREVAGKKDKLTKAIPANSDALQARGGEALQTAHELHLGSKAIRKRPPKTAAPRKSKSSEPNRSDAPAPEMEPTQSVEAEAPATATTTASQPTPALPFPVVGIGASAGGVEAIKALLPHLDKDIGMAFVFIMHLDPKCESKLTEVIAPRSSLLVQKIRSGVTIEPNVIYVMPQDACVTMVGRQLRLVPRQPVPVPMPIDVFFRTLAKEQQNRAIGVLLSGTGSDGTLGVGEIIGQGGITFAQQPGSARHSDLPSSAIEAGNVDFILPPEEIGKELTKLATHTYLAPISTGKKPSAPPGSADMEDPAFALLPSRDDLTVLFALLRSRSGVDFSYYKNGTLNRRIMRRMTLLKVDRFPDYLRYVQEHPRELEGLFEDLLISVTAFFRDPSTFQALQKRILPRILKNRAEDAPLRIWSCGCATGEEAYSLAIIVAEHLHRAGKHVPVQVFASDLNEKGVEKARSGLYHENIALDVPPHLLRRYFVRVDGYYQVSKTIRDMCIFARHNILADPPFSNLDLISCRNMLIYLTPVLQKRIMPLFHFALKPRGYLMLGVSETIGDASDLFQLADRKNKIYSKRLTGARPPLDFEHRSAGRDLPAPAKPAQASRPKIETDEVNVQHKVDRLILNEFSPPGVVINANLDVLQFRGQTSDFLEHQPGAASLNLIKMIRPDLALELRQALNKAFQSGDHVVHQCPELEIRGKKKPIWMEVHPVGSPRSASEERFFLITFHQAASAAVPVEMTPGSAATKPHEKQIIRLNRELEATKQSLQAIIEEQEATNEELRSANEEIQSSNEELQSTNEELETAREELQSTNEELTTLNQELQTRNSELGQLNNDLSNLLSSVQIAIVILDTRSTVRRFTPLAEKLFNLIPSDIGRKFSDLNRTIEFPDLDAVIQGVIDTLMVVEREVQDHGGQWYSVKIRPYRTQESKIEGVILTLYDIDELKRAVKHVISLVRQPLIALTADLKIATANEAFCEWFRVESAQIEEKPFYGISDNSWNTPRMRELLETLLPKQTEVREFPMEHNFPGIGSKSLILNARRFYIEGRGVQMILLAIEDVTPSG